MGAWGRPPSDLLGARTSRSKLSTCAPSAHSTTRRQRRVDSQDESGNRGRGGLAELRGQRRGHGPPPGAGAFDYLDAPIRRVGGKETPAPYSKVLERAALPDAGALAKVIREVLDATRFAR